MVDHVLVVPGHKLEQLNDGREANAFEENLHGSFAAPQERLECAKYKVAILKT